MDDVERLTLDIPTPLAAEVRAAVEAGDYASDGEAVGAALRLWSEARHAPLPDAAVLRRAWDEGKASGLHGPLDFDTLRAEARARLACAQAKPDDAG